MSFAYAGQLFDLTIRFHEQSVRPWLMAPLQVTIQVHLVLSSCPDSLVLADVGSPSRQSSFQGSITSFVRRVVMLTEVEYNGMKIEPFSLVVWVSPGAILRDSLSAGSLEFRFAFFSFVTPRFYPFQGITISLYQHKTTCLMKTEIYSTSQPVLHAGHPLCP